ncbi:cupredoxin domain-containing protein [Paenibacillus radicis (ex Xue et al. 2023)]|uniref:Cupredoxin domain-containing protein n=1 Tax=Paenibacillus radicis (ex Xue et al. 2023) TaxID=2972489 RepID=A0ABT1YTM3_9BACL|nr:cupredoxin domain-containing protein [Paenibacillus radicis (ex Xue et al. 2023)]MCR8636536.1 cupredoxin domain-containing protein [Paenibacillus radicis (ex Xue et al. 2023)]
MKKLIVLAMAVCLVFAISACGKKEETKAPAAPAGAAGGASSAASQDLKLVASNFKFDQAEYKVKKGQDIKVTLENKEGMHGVEIKGLSVKLDGNTKTATFKADKEGTYDIICSVPCGQGHMTMKSKLIVES